MPEARMAVAHLVLIVHLDRASGHAPHRLVVVTQFEGEWLCGGSHGDENYIVSR